MLINYVQISFHSLISGSLDYKTNTLQNISKIYTKGFNLTIPCNTSMSNLGDVCATATIEGMFERVTLNDAIITSLQFSCSSNLKGTRKFIISMGLHHHILF